MSELFVDVDVVRQAGTVILYGAGHAGRDVFQVLTAAGIRIRCILDRRASAGDAFLGVPIYRPDACPVESDVKEQIPVVIGIFNRDVDVPSLAHTLTAQGFTRIVSFVQLHAVYADALGDRFWLTQRAFLDEHAADIRRAEQFWTDDQSQALYRTLIAFRRTGEYDVQLNPRSGDLQYIPSDIPGWLTQRPLRFVDCGAYRGDTIEAIVGSNIGLEASAHFEPDMENFTMLVRRVRELLGEANNCALSWPCAVGDRSSIVGFHHGRGEAGSVGGGDSTVPVVALDDVLAGWRPNFIKMDIEGSEVQALLGARRLISGSRPSLAVCVYHRPDHLWQIPLLLSSWPELHGYRYFLRSHGFDGFDTVLYASPDSNEVRS